MGELLENLNTEQKAAVEHTSGPLLIVAGAGTGKTTVITRRIAYLIEQGLAKPDEILALTFTEKAAGEMQERADLLLPLGYYDLWVSTFHSFCERILKSHALDIGLPNDFKLLNETHQWILIYKNLEKFNLDYYRPLGSPNRFIDALLKHFSRCKDELITPESYLQYAQGLRLETDQPNKTKKKSVKPTSNQTEDDNNNETEIARIEEVANAFHTYEKLKLDNNLMDFGDLINYALELFQKRPEILQHYQNKFKHILVDEFQDTNFAQYQLVKLLSGNDQNLVVVGDDDQSVYKFRGASVSNILKFKEDYPKAKQITLVENYRSSQNILDMAYSFIQGNNPDRLEIKLKIDKKLKSNGKDPGIIQVLEGEDLSSELNTVAKKILEIKNNDQKASWNDFAVLIRANSAAEELLPVLAAAGIPYTFVANRGLYKKPIIVDLTSYMKLLDNAHDSAALYRVLSLPKFHLPHKELSELLHIADKKTLPLYGALEAGLVSSEISIEGKGKIRQLKEYLEKHSKLIKTKTAAEMVVAIIEDLGFEQKLKAETEENAQSRELLDQFYKQIEEYEKDNDHRDLHAFLNFLNLEMQAGDEGVIKFDPNMGPESVKVLTIHSAKGLEFKNIFVINLVEQRFPTREKSEAIEIPAPLIKDILPEGDFHLQEERRLFYVSLTRAKQRLFLTWSKDYGGKREKKPSQFLLETKLVPSEKLSKATGKVLFGKTASGGDKSQVYQVLPTRFSYSAINDFELCPLRYKYKHYLKLPTRGSHHQSFGSTIHKVFEEFLKTYQNNTNLVQADLFGKTPARHPLPEFKFLEQLYEKFWIDDWYLSPAQKQEYKKLGETMLESFYDDLKATKPQTKIIEQFFKLKLGDYDFVGKIDRADQTDSGLAIIDYKTGKTPKNKADIDQLHIYQWAAEEFLRAKVCELKYWYLQDGREGFKPEELATAEEIKDLKSRLLSTIEKIVDSVKFDRFKEAHAQTTKHQCEFEDFE